MALIDEVIKYFKDKPVVVVTTLESEDYHEEIVGILMDGGDGCLVVQQGDDDSPTIINAAHVAWVYEETSDGVAEEE